MSKSNRLLAILLAVLMAVSVFPVSVFADGGVITAVDIVTETVFPTGIVTEEPVFYDTIRVKIGDSDEWTELSGVTWTRQEEGEWDGTTVDKVYTYKPTIPVDYTWDDGVEPTITVKIVDAVPSANSTGARQGFFSSNPKILVPYVVKANRAAYDATGCVLLVADIGQYPNGGHVSGATGVSPSEGTTSITVTDNVSLKEVFGGGCVVPHVGDTYVYVDDATVGTVFGGGSSANVTGNAHIDVTGKVTISKLRGGSYPKTSLSGTAYITIHDLEEGSNINNTGIGSAGKLVVNLDDTSKSLLSDGKITGVTTDGYTDENVAVYINTADAIDSNPDVKCIGEKFEGMTSVPVGLEVPASIVKGTKDAVLPTVEGFRWEGDDATAGEKEFKLVANEGYFLDGLVKSQKYTVTVTEGTVEATSVSLDKTEESLRVGQSVTLTATVEPENVTDPTVTWTASENVELSETTGATVTATVTAEGEATVTATSGNVSANCVITVSPKLVITEFDKNGIVQATTFPYSNKDNAAGRWSDAMTSYVDAPVFYDTLVATVNGEQVTVTDVTWVCTTEYDGTAVGEKFTFVPYIPGYEIEDETMAIEVTIADAGWAADLSSSKYSMEGFAVLATTANSAGKPIEFVIKNDEPYDATGCNKLVQDYVFSDKNNVFFFAAYNATPTGIASKTAATNSEGTVKVTVENSTQIDQLLGGGRNGTGHTGNVIINVKDSTLGSIYGAGRGTPVTGNININISGETTITGSLYGGGWGAAATVTGDSTVDITGKATLANIYGGGYNGASLSGTQYVTIHALKEGSTLSGKIQRNQAAKLVVNLDDTSAFLLDKVADWKTDENIEVYINGDRQIPVAGVEISGATEVEVDSTIELTATVSPEDATEDKTVTWSASENVTLSETTGDTVTVTGVTEGTATITATAGDVSDTYTVEVKAKTIAVTKVTLNKETAEVEKGNTVDLTATVEPADATNPTVTWAVTEGADYVELNTTTGNTITVTAKATGTAKISATADGVPATCTVTVFEYADYSIVENADAAVVKTNDGTYTNASFAAYTAEVAEVQADKPAEGLLKTEEGKYTDYAAALTAAKNLLKVKASYTSVDAQVEAAGKIDKSLYTDASLAKLDEALENVNCDLDVDQQATVNSYATAIENALNALIKKVVVANLAVELDAVPTTVNMNAQLVLPTEFAAYPGVLFTWEVVTTTRTVVDTSVPGTYTFNLVEPEGYELTEEVTKTIEVVDTTVYVAQVGDVKYETLAEAVAVGGEVKLLTPVVLTERLDVATDVTLNLNGNTISASFEDTFGTIYVKKGATLTVEGNGTITSSGTYAIGNYGTVVVNGGTIESTAADSAALYNFYYQADYYGTSVIDGGNVGTVWNCGVLTVENGEVAYLDNSGALTVNGGTITEIYAQDGTDAAGVTGAGTIAIADTSAVTLPDGYKLVEESEGVYKVVAKTYVAEAGGVKYETLAEAVAAGNEVKLLMDASGDGMVIDKDVTIDLGGFTYTINGALVGSKGTETLGFQILKDNNVTIKNGTIAADVAAIEANATNVANGNKTLKVLVMNYANLTLEDVTLDMSSVAAMLYVVSNNSGTTAITGTTSITAPEGAVAFDVYDYTAGGYTVPKVTVDTTGTITGAIEVSDTATLEVANGTYTVDVKDYCVDGYTTEDNGDGTYGIVVEANYTAVKEALATIPADLTIFTDVTVQAVEAAVEAVEYDLPVSKQTTVDGYAAAINTAVGNLAKKPANYKVVEDAIAAANALTKENYVSFADVEAAITAVDYTKTIDQQAEVDAMAAAINTAVGNLAKKPADYKVVEDAIAAANALTKENYVSFADVETAINAVDYTKTIDQQAEVDAMAKAINDAVSVLVLKGADYSAVETAKGKVPADLTIYTDATAQAVTDAVTNVVYNLDITEQARVDEFAKAINDAVAKLAPKNVRTITLVPSAEEVYTNETFTVDVKISNVDAKGAKWTLTYDSNYFDLVGLVVKQGVNHVSDTSPEIIIENGTFTTNAVATYTFKAKDTAAENVPFTLSNVEIRTAEESYLGLPVVDAHIINTDVTIILGGADYTEVEEAIKEYNDLEHKEYYTDESIKAVEDAIDAVDYSLPATRQDEVDAMADAINDAISKLEKKPADYTKVDTAIDEYEEEIVKTDLYTAESIEAAEAAYALVVIDRNLKIDEQDIVDGYEAAIKDAISKLVKKPADYTKVDAAIDEYEAEIVKTDLYTVESIEAAEAAYALVVIDRNLKVDEQDIVDGYETAIKDAIGKLVKKPADYTKVDAAIDEYEEEIAKTDLYTAESIEAAEAAYALVVIDRNLKIDEQDIVDGYETAIKAATAKLALKDADYSAVEAAKDKVDALDRALYTADSLAAVDTAVNAVVEGKKITEQAEVDAMAKAINDAIAALKIKYVVEVGTTEGTDYVDNAKLVLVYTNDVTTFKYDGIQMFDVTAAGYTYSGTDFTMTANTKVYGLVVVALSGNTVADYEALVTEGTDAATAIDYSDVNDVNFSAKVDWDDIISVYAVAEHNPDAFARAMEVVIKADTNRDKIARGDDASSIITEVFGNNANN